MRPTRLAVLILISATILGQPLPAHAKFFRRAIGACQALLGGKKVTESKPKVVAPVILKGEYPAVRKASFASLDDIMRAFSRGLVPDLKNPDQADAYFTYLTTWFGQSSQRRPSVEKFQTLIDLQTRFPELMAQVRFRNQLVKVSNAPPMPVPPELRAATDRLLRVAKTNSAKVLKFEANMGNYRKMLHQQEAPIEELLPASLREQLNNEKTSIQDKLKSIFKFLQVKREELLKAGKNVRPISQTLVDIVHNAGFLNPLLMNRLQSEFSAVRIGALSEALQIRDSLAMELGFENHFQQILDDYKIPSPNGVERPTELNLLLNRLQNIVVKQGLDEENVSEKVLRHLGVFEQPFRSCIGGSDCSSDTYFEFGMEPATHYFTLTESDGSSSGHVTIVLGTIEGVDGMAAFVDKVQNVPPNAVLPMLEGIRLSIAELGYTLYVSRDAEHSHSGVSNDFQTADAFTAIVEKMPDPKFKGFRPLPSKYNFSHAYSRAFKSETEVVKFQSPTDLQIKPLEVDRPWSTAELNFREVLSETLKLKDGSWSDRTKYFRLLPLLESLKLVEQGETDKLAQKWLVDASIPIRLLKEISVHVLDFRANSTTFSKLLFQRPWEDRQKVISHFQSTRPHRLRDFDIVLLAADQPRYLAELGKGMQFSSLANNITALKHAPLSQDLKMQSAFALLEGLRRYPPQFLEFIKSDPRFANDLAMNYSIQRALDSRWTDAEIIENLLGMAKAENSIYTAHSFKVNLRGDIKQAVQTAIESDPETSVLWKAKLDDDLRYKHECFVAGTLIDTPNGPRTIESLNAGDHVLSYDPVKRETVVDQVKARVAGSEHRMVQTLTFSDGRSITSSGEHPVYSISKRDYIPANRLELGDSVLVLRKGKLVSRKLVSRKVEKDRARIFNFQTEKQHNYFSNGVLVHNKVVVWL